VNRLHKGIDHRRAAIATIEFTPFDADGYGNVDAAYAKRRCGNRRQKTFGEVPRPPQVGVPQDHHELFAAPAHAALFTPERGADAARALHQHAVCRRMPM
jgi:hypothetical protein